MRDVRAGVLEPRRVVHHEPRRLELGARLRELELNALKIGELLSELRALLHVFGRGVQRARGDADHLRADADASFVQRLDRDLVALADGAEHVRRGHFDVVENQLRRARRADAELVFLLADAESLEAALDDERRDALVARRRIRVGEDDVDLAPRRRW